jgi:excisionase family DNA binding protein
MSTPIDEACKYAIEQAKKKLAAEVTADDLLLGCFRTVSQFGIVELGPWRFDLEALGMDWLSCGERKKQKVAYSQGVVGLLDLASRIAHSDSRTVATVEDLLAAYAGREDGLIGDLKREYKITSADWRAAVGASAQKTRTSLNAGLTAAPARLDTREYLTPEEAAETLAVHVQTLRGHVRSGKLPALRLAGERAIRIRRADLEKIFEPCSPSD